MSALTIDDPRDVEALPDGVWLNLPAPQYFPQGLGSTDLIRLHKYKLGWWWSSRHNPRHQPSESDAQTYGSALHKIVLEGRDAYNRAFAVEPTWPRDTIDTIDEIKARLLKEGFKLVNTSGWRHPDWCKAMRDNLPRVPVLTNLQADWRRRIAGDREVISADDDWSLNFMFEVIHDKARKDNAEVRTLFAGDGGYPPLAEVSIFKTLDDGTRRRWRIDRMFPSFDLDLKSLGNWRGRPLDWMTGDLIAQLGYDIQRADYYEARVAAYEHIAAGRLFGGTADQRAWIRRFPQEFPAWDWVWLFYQKPDSVNGRAPVLFPVWDDNFDGEARPSRLRRYGMNKATKALRLYRSAVAEFGLDKPWARVEPLHYSDDRMEPNVKFPAHIAEEEPTDEAAYV